MRLAQALHQIARAKHVHVSGEINNVARVLMTPGVMQLTVTDGANSIASVCDRATTGAFDAR